MNIREEFIKKVEISCVFCKRYDKERSLNCNKCINYCPSNAMGELNNFKLSKKTEGILEIIQKIIEESLGGK